MLSGKKNKAELYSCHEENEKKRCPLCGSLKTKKNGFIESGILTSRGKVKRRIHRFFCKDCGKSFTDQGYNVRKRITDDLKKKVVEDFVFTKSSTSEVGHRFGISKMTVINWTNGLANGYPAIEKIRGGVKWSGWITIDGKELKVKGQRIVILTACDAENGKPFYYLIVRGENKETAKWFLKKVKKLYPVRINGITSDFGKGKCFLGVIAKLFPQIPHQICNIHFNRYVWLFLPRTRKSKYFWRNSVMKEMIRRILDAPSREESLYWYEKFISWAPFFRARYHQRFIRSMRRNYWNLTMHYEIPEIPVTSNVSENLNRQLERKLKNMDGFKSEASLTAFMRIWFANYRIK